MQTEILQSWMKDAWIYPMEGPNDNVVLRVTPGGRLKMRRRIAELESSLGISGTELAEQEEAGTLPVEREKLELAMMVQAYTLERRFMQETGTALGTPAVSLEQSAEEPPEEQDTEVGERAGD